MNCEYHILRKQWGTMYSQFLCPDSWPCVSLWHLNIDCNRSWVYKPIWSGMNFGCLLFIAVKLALVILIRNMHWTMTLRSSAAKSINSNYFNSSLQKLVSLKPKMSWTIMYVARPCSRPASGNRWPPCPVALILRVKLFTQTHFRSLFGFAIRDCLLHASSVN